MHLKFSIFFLISIIDLYYFRQGSVGQGEVGVGEWARERNSSNVFDIRWGGNISTMCKSSQVNLETDLFSCRMFAKKTRPLIS